MPIEIRLLGTVGAAVDGSDVELGPPQQRALLALLALHRGNRVRVEAIVDALWPDDPPPSAAKVVQTYVSRLRKTLGADAISRVDSGYALAPGVDVDALRFRELVGAGRVEEALALWRGDALTDVPLLDVEARRLEDLRLAALEDRIEREPPSVAELETLVAEHPTRERLIGQLVRALYRSGRQTDALAVYRDARRRLAEEYGLEPSPELRELERRVLRHDPTLLEQPAPPAARGRRYRLLAAVVILVVAAATAVSVVLTRGGDRAIGIRANTVIGIDPATDRVVASFPVGRAPTGIDATADALWVASETERKVARIDLHTHDIATIGMPHPIAFLTHDDEGAVYASAWDFPFVWKIDPKRVEVAHTWRVKTRALGLAVGGGSLWVVDRLANAVTRIDLARRRVEPPISVGADPLVLAFGFGAVWVANSDDASVSVIRPGVMVPAAIYGPEKAFGITAGAGAVWVTSNASSRLYKIDPDTRRIVARIDVSNLRRANDVFDVAAGTGGVWVANRGAAEIVHVDPATDRVVGRIEFPTGTEPHNIAVTPTMIWVTVANPADDT